MKKLVFITAILTILVAGNWTYNTLRPPFPELSVKELRLGQKIWMSRMWYDHVIFGNCLTETGKHYEVEAIDKESVTFLYRAGEGAGYGSSCPNNIGLVLSKESLNNTFQGWQKYNQEMRSEKILVAKLLLKRYTDYSSLRVKKGPVPPDYELTRQPLKIRNFLPIPNTNRRWNDPPTLSFDDSCYLEESDELTEIENFQNRILVNVKVGPGTHFNESCLNAIGFLPKTSWDRLQNQTN